MTARRIASACPLLIALVLLPAGCRKSAEPRAPATVQGPPGSTGVAQAPPQKERPKPPTTPAPTPKKNTPVVTPVVKVDPPPSDTPARPPRKRRPAPPLNLGDIGSAAVVDRTGLPAGALFEAKALGRDKLKWVERAAIDKVVGEQNLQAAFGPEGGADRVNLGKLLKADLLVLLRSGESESKKKAIELVVCESKRGLRLASQAVPVSGDAGKDVEDLDAILDASLVKLSEKITDVCAVPPFVNQDLGYQFNHLAGGFSRLLEQHLLKRKGVLLVELAEAQSLTKEAAIGGDAAERQLPLYFLGEYRNTGKGDERRLSLTVQVKRGLKSIGTKSAANVTPADTAKALTRLTDELAAAVVTGKDAGEIDTDDEIDQLLERARVFQALGNYSECLGMLEAAALLDPTRRETHYLATTVLCKMADAQFRVFGGKDALKILHLHRQALEHFEIGSKQKGPAIPAKPSNDQPPPDQYPALSFASNICRELKFLVKGDPAFNEQYDDVMRFELAVLLAFCRSRSHLRAGDEHRPLEYALAGQPPETGAAIVRTLIFELKDLQFAVERTARFAGMRVTQDRYRSAIDYDPKLITDLRNDPVLKASVPLIEQYRAQMNVPITPIAKVDLQPKVPKTIDPPVKSKGGPEPTGSPLQPVKLALELKPAVELGKKLDDFMSITPLGPGVDLVIASNTIYLMREKGLLRPVYEHKSTNSYAEFACYDGKHAWISITGMQGFGGQRGGVPELLVLDLADGSVHKIGPKEGLVVIPTETLPDPTVTQHIMLAPIAPGRVLLVGSFGRTWLGIATFEGPQKKKVEVIHEAREIPEPRDEQVWKKNSIGFQPAAVHVVHFPGDDARKGPVRIVVGRKSPNHLVECHPLIVDPDKRSVEVFAQMFAPESLIDGKVHQGSLVFRNNFAGLELTRMDASGKWTPMGIPGLKGHFLVILGDDLFVAGDKEWFRGSLSRKQIAASGPVGIARPGGIRAGGASHHYGYVARYNRLDGSGYELLHVASPK